MHKTRSWQDSFDRLAAARREEQLPPDTEQQHIRDAEAAYAQAAALRTDSPPTIALKLVSERPAPVEKLAKTKPRTKRPKTRAAPRKRAPARQTAAKAKARKPAPQPALILADALPAATAEQLLITPLPRNAALTPYRKTGLFSLIGSWLRLAGRQVATGPADSARRPKAPLKPRPSGDEIAELRAENQRLRRQLDALLALREMKEKMH